MHEDSLTRILNERDPVAPEHVGIAQQLRDIALRQLRDAPSPSIEATSLVQRSWLKLLATPTWDSRAHFFGSAARAMRQVLVDLARERAARARRESASARTIETAEDPSALGLEIALELDALIDHLAIEHPAIADVVCLKAFACSSNRVIAEALEVDVRTVQRHLAFARATLERLRTDGFGRTPAPPAP